MMKHIFTLYLTLSCLIVASCSPHRSDYLEPYEPNEEGTSLQTVSGIHNYFGFVPVSDIDHVDSCSVSYFAEQRFQEFSDFMITVPEIPFDTTGIAISHEIVCWVCGTVFFEKNNKGYGEWDKIMGAQIEFVDIQSYTSKERIAHINKESTEIAPNYQRLMLSIKDFYLKSVINAKYSYPAIKCNYDCPSFSIKLKEGESPKRLSSDGKWSPM